MFSRSLAYHCSPRIYPMIRLVWRSITERKARSLLLLVAVLVVSASFGLLLSAAETSKVTVDQNLEKYWRTTYDILVRPPGNRSLIEEKYDLVQTYHLGNILGGISFEQFEAIKRIPGVDVAAPIAMLSYFDMRMPLSFLEGPTLTEEGVYKIVLLRVELQPYFIEGSLVYIADYYAAACSAEDVAEGVYVDSFGR